MAWNSGLNWTVHKIAAYKKGMVKKMKQTKWRGILLVMLGCLMLTGCGEAPYELTDEEQQLIVSYSAHVVSKFNRYQKDGLTHVPNLEEELADEQEIVPETEVVPETEQPEENTESLQPESGEVIESTEVVEPTEETTFDSVFADSGLTFTYVGNEVTASYMEDDTYAVNAGFEKKLLVLKLKVENLTEEAIVVDNLSSEDVFSAKYMLESGKTYHAKSVMTLLLNDFTTYEGTIEPQASVDMVIVFEIPAETESVEEIELKIEKNGEKFQINL